MRNKINQKITCDICGKLTMLRQINRHKKSKFCKKV